MPKGKLAGPAKTALTLLKSVTSSFISQNTIVRVQNTCVSEATARKVAPFSGNCDSGLPSRCFQGCERGEPFSWGLSNASSAWEAQLSWPPDPMWTESNWLDPSVPKYRLYQVKRDSYHHIVCLSSSCQPPCVMHIRNLVSWPLGFFTRSVASPVSWILKADRSP